MKFNYTLFILLSRLAAPEKENLRSFFVFDVLSSFFVGRPAERFNFQIRSKALRTTRRSWCYGLKIPGAVLRSRLEHL